MERSEIDNLLYNAAVSQAVAQGFQLGDGADDAMRSYAATASRDPAFAARDAVLQERLVDAVRAFRLLVDNMIASRRLAYADRPDRIASNVIGEETLSLSLGRLCPGLWPIC